MDDINSEKTEIGHAPETTHVPSHPANSGSLIIGFITIVLCIGLGFMLGKNTTVRPIAEPIQAIATPAPDPFANWITFSNTLFPFEFRYPKELSSFIRLTEKGTTMDSPDGGDMPLVKIDRYETSLAPTTWWYTYGLAYYPWMYNIAINPLDGNTKTNIKGTEIVGQRKTSVGIVMPESLVLFPYQNTIYVLYINRNDYSSPLLSYTHVRSSFQFVSADPRAASVNVVNN